MNRSRRLLLLSGVLCVLLICLVVWFWRVPGRGIRVGTGLVSKTLCTGVFVSGLDPDALYVEAVKPIPGQTRLAKHLKYVVDRSAREVTATWWGGFESRAVYREGFGCSLVHDNEPRGSVMKAATTDQTAPLEILPPSPPLETGLDHIFREPEKPPFRHVKAVVILHHGKVVAERYAPGYSKDTPILGFSLAKSVTNALIGILVQQKKLSVEQIAPVPEWSNPSDPRHAITIEELMRMSSGLDIEEGDSGFDPVSRMLFLEPNMAGFAARSKLKAAPGTQWEYTSGNTLILSRIIRDAVGGHAEDVVEFAKKELFGPLGIKTATIEFDAAGTPVGSIFILLSARDWAKFGELYRNDGVVNGRRILPEGWVKFSASPTLDHDYGAGFWTNRSAHGESAQARIRMGMPEDTFYGSGNLGQRVVVIPSEGLVIVRLGLTHSPGFDMKGLLQLISETRAAFKQPINPTNSGASRSTSSRVRVSRIISCVPGSENAQIFDSIDHCYSCERDALWQKHRAED
jgi:CubicO group peptidase (beta-lactamase class C family)